MTLLIKNLYLPLINTPVVGAAANGDNLTGCHPNALHLLPTAIFKRKNMRKTNILLILSLCSIFFSSGAAAQNKPIACQAEKAAGLDWSNSQWVTTNFNPAPSKFILIQTIDALTEESVAKILDSSVDEIQCKKNVFFQISCSDDFGGYLFFDRKNLKGGISRLYGAITADGKTTKDSISVTAFSCIPF